MEISLAVPLLGLVGSTVVAVLTYWFAKLRDIETERRKEKLTYYKAFIESFSGIVDGDATPDGHLAFSRATNNLLLFAPQKVLSALNEFRSEIAVSNAAARTSEKHDALLAQLLLAIRHDVGVNPKDDPTSFHPIIWASGARKSAT
jgi:hypothetical protein